jgi:hypothetical protein
MRKRKKIDKLEKKILTKTYKDKKKYFFSVSFSIHHVKLEQRKRKNKQRMKLIKKENTTKAQSQEKKKYKRKPW